MKSKKNNIIVAVDGPSGVGKDTVIQKLIEMYPGLFVKAASTTTRPMRENESEGNPYFFVSDKEFLDKVKSGDIFEHTTRHGTYRGMSKCIFDSILNNGQIPIKDCDYIGLNALKKIYPGKVIGIFISAPKEMIIKRLIARDKNDSTLDARIADYDNFIKTKVHYDYEVENIDVSKTAKDIVKLIEKFCGQKL